MDAKFLKFILDDINSKIVILRGFGVEVVDNEDFGFAIDYMYYSSGQDEVICKFKKAIKEAV